jgi:hypothetical protein
MFSNNLRRNINSILLKNNKNNFNNIKNYKKISSLINFIEPNKNKINIEFNNLVEMFEKATQIHKDAPLFGVLNKDKNFIWLTYFEFSLEVQKFRNILRELNFERHDKVAVIANNRWVHLIIVGFI